MTTENQRVEWSDSKGIQYLTTQKIRGTQAMFTVLKKQPDNKKYFHFRPALESR